MNRKAKNEVFELTDYTNVTEFEEFIHSVEQVLDAWGLSHGKIWNKTTLPEFSRTENVVYNSQSFKLTHSTIHRKTDQHPLLQVT